MLRRRPRHRDEVAPADFYRASTTLTETRRCTSAAVAQVAEAAAVARSVVHVAVVSCVLLLVLLFWDIPFPCPPHSFCIDCNSYTVIIAVAVLLLFCFLL